jgi:putative membrane protein
MGGGSGLPAVVRVAAWITLAVLLALIVACSWNPTPFAQGLAAIAIAAALIHAMRNYGIRHGLGLFAICLAITFTMENIGTRTGFPFGHYRFAVGANLPHVGAIPIIVGPLWFGMGYFSWVIAAMLLNGADRHLHARSNLTLLPVVAALVMTAWDVVMDPPASTIAKAWIWQDGGVYFGVPLSNFAGWLLTSWLFFQAFALYLRGRNLPPSRSRSFCSIALLFYAAAALAYFVPWAFGQGGTVTDPAGHIWRVADIREASVIAMLCTMMIAVLLASWRLLKPGNRIEPLSRLNGPA